MIQIRKNVFETNSSSTHSLTIVGQDEFKKFQEGELYFFDNYKLVTKEYLIEYAKNDEYFEGDIDNFDEIIEYYDYEIKTYEEVMDNEYLESFIKEFTTESGDKIVAFGNYGYNG